MDKYTGLQEQYEDLCEKIFRLRKALAIETDTIDKFKLEKQIEESEQERFELEKKLEFLQEDRIILNLKGTKNEVHCIFSNNAIIGRSSTCGFWVNDESNKISKLHAVIYYKLKNNEYWIEDLKSVNGTYVDGVKIQQPTPLSWGARIQLGTFLFLLFEHNKNDSLSPGVLIQHNSEGEEAARYIIVPKGKALVGTSTNEVVRFPNFRDEKSLGSIVRKQDSFYFIRVDNEEVLLKHNMELSLDFFKVGVTILSIVPKETLDETNIVVDDL